MGNLKNFIAMFGFGDVKKSIKLECCHNISENKEV